MRGQPQTPKNLLKNVRVTKNGCWNWQQWIDKLGYGQVSFQGKVHLAHRVFFLVFTGELPKELDHLCDNRRCCNPEHLKPVTHYENLMRGNGMGAINRDKTHCIRGHKFTPKNTYLPKNGQRQCRKCNNLRNREVQKNQ